MPKNTTPRSITLALGLTAFVAVANTNAAEIVGAKHRDQPRTEMLANPVFKSHAYLEQWGNEANPPVILVHGLGNNGTRDWQHLAPLLSKKFHVIAFDLPGLARSTKFNELYSPDNYARFIDWVATTYAKEPFTLIGHSMGGAIALDYAATHPRKLKQLILIDAAGILYRTSYSRYLLDDFKPVWWANLIPSSEQLNKMLGFGIEDYDRFPLAINLILATGFTRSKFLGADPVKIAGLAMVQKDFSGMLDAVNMPTLLVWGGRDTIAPLRTGKMLQSLLSDARLEIIPEAQHVPMMQTPDQLNKIVWEAVTNSQFVSAAKPKQTIYAANSNKDESCKQQQDRYYSGRYTRLIIDECQHVTIENAKIDFLKVKNSSVTIYDSEIGGKKTALQADNATVFATASKFSAAIPIEAENSRLDFAGVDIKATQQGFKSQLQTYVTFSLCTMESPQFTGNLHGVYPMSAAEQPF